MSGDRQQPPPPPPSDPLKCPRCHSLDTKFCYYNNYSTAQPRHFCKNCKRYWTAGGSLRNVPVGGGLRKNKKAKLAKQASDMASASSDEQHFGGPMTNSHLVNPNPGSDGFPYSDANGGTFLLGSPSSSADAGAIDENLVNSTASVLPYSTPSSFRYFDTASESYYTGDYSSSGLSNPYLGARNGTDIFGEHSPGLFGKGSQQQQQKDSVHGSIKRRRVLAAGSNGFGMSEVATELSTDASKYSDLGIPSRYPDNLQQVNSQDSMAMWQQNYYEPGVSQGQSSLQSSTEELVASQDGKSRTERTGLEEEDEGLGNVVNVRYPYDWDQVSEVLFGGTPDFFQMPGF